MKRKIILILGLICICLCLSSCAENEYDTIFIYNRSVTDVDDIHIDTKEGYFYDKHEKFTVDDDTIGVTIYFTYTNENDDTWDNKKPVEEVENNQ